MTIAVKERERTVRRAGAQALILLSTPLTVHVLDALADGPQSLAEMRRLAGFPPQTTMRAHLRRMTVAGILERHQPQGFAASVAYGLGPSGRGLLAVASSVRDWLSACPGGCIDAGTPSAKSALKALSEGWSSGVVRALAARPLSLTDLSSIIGGISYPSLERRLAAMRLTGQIVRSESGGRSTPYEVSEWLRRAAGPLTAAARWERRYLREETAPIKKIDIEAVFLLAVPLVRLDRGISGRSRFVVESRSAGGKSRLAGVTVALQSGRIVSCVSKLEGEVDSWITGSLAAWARAVGASDGRQLEMGGDGALAVGLLESLQSVFSPSRTGA